MSEISTILWVPRGPGLACGSHAENLTEGRSGTYQNPRFSAPVSHLVQLVYHKRTPHGGHLGPRPSGEALAPLMVSLSQRKSTRCAAHLGMVLDAKERRTSLPLASRALVSLPPSASGVEAREGSSWLVLITRLSLFKQAL
jgi:hypothetical protein